MAKENSKPMRLMPDRYDLGSYMASTTGQAIYQRDKGPEKVFEGSRYVMGYRLPSWQREFVWTQDQSIRLIESLWRGVNIGTYTFNRNHSNLLLDDLLIDGQQRMKAIQDYMQDAFPVFGYRYSEITHVDKRFFEGTHFHCYITESDDEQYLRGYYNMMNFSGTAHTKEQIA